MRYDLLMIGVVVSLLFFECARVSPGGLIVPAYLALRLNEPLDILLTVAVMIVTFFILRGLEHWVILYGRRSFALALIIAFLLSAGIGAVGLAQVSVIGMLVPGLAVRDMQRQGLLSTLAAMAAVLGLLALIYMAVGAL